MKILKLLLNILFKTIKLVFKFLKWLLSRKWFYFSMFFGVVLPALFFYGLYRAYEYKDQVYNEIFSTGYEIGRYDQLMEDDETSKAEIAEKKKQAQIKILNTLARIESGNGEVRKILDTNNRYSLGLYHFQAATVKDLYRRYYNKTLTTEQAVEIAENDELATKLAHDAIFVKKELFHWKLSFCRMANRGEIDYKCDLKNSKFSLK